MTASNQSPASQLSDRTGIRARVLCIIPHGGGRHELTSSVHAKGAPWGTFTCQKTKKVCKRQPLQRPARLQLGKLQYSHRVPNSRKTTLGKEDPFKSLTSGLSV